MRAVDFHLDWSNQFNLWSGLIGGGFLALAYFGCDQSQVQRYLTGRSVGQSRLSLMFTALVKIPMQLFILFIGAIVFVVSLFAPSPAIFQPVQAKVAMRAPDWKAADSMYRQAFEERRRAAYQFTAALHGGNPEPEARHLRDAQSSFNAARQAALGVVARLQGSKFDDTNYIFLSFVMRYLPVGLVGLVIGVIFSASMGSTSGEINALATVSVIDIYGRYIARQRSDRHYLIASRALTLFWGAFAVLFAVLGGRGFGALIVRVNIVGSLFYGTLLGVFVLAFGFKRVGGTAAFAGAVVGETATLLIARLTGLSFLWYNVAGCLAVVATALLITLARPEA
jgi:Na+/proline symporter